MNFPEDYPYCIGPMKFWLCCKLMGILQEEDVDLPLMYHTGQDSIILENVIIEFERSQRNWIGFRNRAIKNTSNRREGSSFHYIAFRDVSVAMVYFMKYDLTLLKSVDLIS